MWIDCQHWYLYDETKENIKFLKAVSETSCVRLEVCSCLRFVSFSSSWFLFLLFLLSFVISYSVSIITDTAREKKSKTAKPSSYMLCLLYKFTSFYWIFSRISYARKNKTFSCYTCWVNMNVGFLPQNKKMERSAKYFFLHHITLSSVFASRRFPVMNKLISYPHLLQAARFSTRDVAIRSCFASLYTQQLIGLFCFWRNLRN